MGGCDLMRCGQDYHGIGGGGRVGCGETFRWTTAKPYTPTRERPKVEGENKPEPGRTWVDWWWGEGWKEELERKKREKIYTQTHTLSPDLPLHLCCDGCKKEIKGPLLRCLNCPAVDLCLVCGIRGEAGEQGVGGDKGDGRADEWTWAGLSPELLWGDDNARIKKARKVSTKPDGYIPKHLSSHVCLVILPKMG
ncbi:hypothetical protein EON65_22645 [archaeon]|nr:MAG: hypothetical protein EON65_22645 [archaeon]